MAIDLENGYEELRGHVGHTIEVVRYGPAKHPMNIAIECETCGCVLLDFDRPEEEDDEDYEERMYL